VVPQDEARSAEAISPGAPINQCKASAKTLNLSNIPASQRDMTKAKAAIKTLSIIDIPGCSD